MALSNDTVLIEYEPSAPGSTFKAKNITISITIDIDGNSKV